MVYRFAHFMRSIFVHIGKTFSAKLRHSDKGSCLPIKDNRILLGKTNNKTHRIQKNPVRFNQNLLL